VLRYDRGEQRYYTGEHDSQTAEPAEQNKMRIYKPPNKPKECIQKQIYMHMRWEMKGEDTNLCLDRKRGSMHAQTEQPGRKETKK
jgi:hypothetical protein